METKKYFNKKWIMGWFAIATFATALAACGSKGGGNSTPAVVTTTAAICAGCGSIGPTLATLTSSSPFSASWIFSGDTNMINQFHAMYPYEQDISRIYQGPLAITGTITFQAFNGQMGNCPMPITNGAAFSVGTVSPGTEIYGTTGTYGANSPQMQASNGATSFTFTIVQGIIYLNSFSGYLSITSVNGAPCVAQIPFY